MSQSTLLLVINSGFLTGFRIYFLYWTPRSNPKLNHKNFA